MYEVPGRRVKLKETTKQTCDEHPEVKAVWRLTGETDSFGSEYSYECQACCEANIEAEDDYQDAIPDDHVEFCEIGKHKVNYFSLKDGARSRNTVLTTDPTEGGGRLYNMCYACLTNLLDNV